ncbi:MAG: hypothetical protein SFW67_25525 [Myxococcaceae bacterium]|nr:hypothetical protein [Myxococcaceae bacterium]
MHRMAWLGGLVAAVAVAAPNPKIAEAKQHLDDLELEKAAKALAAAEAQPGNDRAQTLEILTLQGIVFGTMNKEAKVRDAFRKLLILAPDFTLTGDQPPRVRTPFYEAKEWVAANEPLQVEATSGALSRGVELAVTVRRDTLRLVKRVRFLVGETGPREVAVENSAAKLIIEAPVGSWRVELLGARDAVLLQQGPFDEPGGSTSAAATKPAPVPPQPPAEAVAPSTSAAAVEARSSPPPNGWMRPTAWALVGVAVVASLVGLGLGVDANTTRQRLTGLIPNEAGLIVGLTQRDALAQEAAARGQAIAANGLFIGAGVLAAAGVVLFILGAPEERVSVGFSPNGVLVQGSFQ